MDWATYIRRLRRGRGLTLAAFGALMDVGQTTVWRWEEGLSIPSPAQHDRIRRLAFLPDTAADKAAIEAARSSRRVASLTGVDNDRYLMVSDGVCSLQGASRPGLMAVARSRSASEEARRVMADRATIQGLFSSELAAVRIVNMVPSYHGGPGFWLETIWTPVVLSDGTRTFRNDSRRAVAPLRPMVEAIALSDLTEPLADVG